MAVTMDGQTDDALDAIAKEPEELDGHTIDELADYLDAGRTLPDPSIEGSAACRHALAALERLRALAPELLVDDAPEAEPADGFLARVMSGIALDAHAGADFPLVDSGTDSSITMTEGALRALIRAAGDGEPGVLVGRVRFVGDLQDPHAPLTVRVAATVAHGLPIPAAAERLRAAVDAAVRRHTRFERLRIDVEVQDLVVRGEDRP
ncbi:hypothetical protein [Amnibacterium endophyticum]|uniref:Asp23/Gls24 family envelope stress response protein n=1 Tax=Amnibacterium endophyticum TaxID=2109337 RepID=A0ABW4LDB9_9MICO